MKTAAATKTSHCFAIGCKVRVEPTKFGCREHWEMLPMPFQDEVWAAYRGRNRVRTLELARDAMVMVRVMEAVTAKSKKAKGKKA